MSSKPLPSLPKVTLVARSSLAAGGLEKQLLRISNAFLQKGAPVHLLTSYPNPQLASTPITYSLVKTPRYPRFLLPKLFDLSSFQSHAKDPSTIVFGIDRISYATHLRAGNGVHRAYLERRRLTSSLSFPYIRFFNPLHHTLLKLEKASFLSPSLRLIFTNSHMVKNEILDFYGVDPKLIRVIHNGVEWQELAVPFSRWPREKSRLCKVLSLDPHLHYFLFVGHGFERKGLSFLLDAFAALSKPECHLIVVGQDSHRLSFFQKKCHTLKIENQVTFVGNVQNTSPFYSLADTLVIPSLYDPFANVTLEALAMGLYVISSPFNGGAEILQKETGIVLADLFDRDHFSFALEQALARKKTIKSAINIRSSVKSLDFSLQLSTLVEETFASL